MKRITLLIALLFAGLSSIFAQTTTTLPYQAVVRNTQNRLVQDSTFALDVQIYEGMTQKYAETHTVTTNHNGLLTLNIGGGTITSGAMSGITDWSEATFKFTYHLQGGNVVIEQRVQAVPYALQAAQATNIGSISVLTNRVNEFNTHVCDSVAACLPSNSDLQDAINNVTATYLTTNNYVTTTTMDARHYLTSDSTVITTIRSEISALQGSDHSHTNKDVLDRIEKAYTAADSTKLAGIAEGAEANVQSDWNQTSTTADDYIKNKPTIPTTVAELSDKDDYVTKAGSNVYTGSNDFTGATTTVASGFTFGTTTSSTCGDIAVNACDLLNVFDSIQRTFAALNARISAMSDTLRSLRAAEPPTFQTLPTVPTSTTLATTANFHDGGATITAYNFCISESADMTTQSCYIESSNRHTFTGLNPASTYYITVSATNLRGTTISSVQSATTLAAMPTAGTATVTATDPAGFSVEVPSITTGGAPTAEARVCYGVMTGGDCSDVTYDCTGWETITAGTYNNTVTNLSHPGATYCVKTEIATNGGDSVLTVGPSTVTVPTVAPTLGTPTVTAQTGTSLTVSVPVTDNGGAAITAATLCAYTDAECTTPAGGICATSVDYSSTPITGTITGLTPGTSYYVKATATNDSKTGTSTMTSPASTLVVPPTLSTPTVTPTSDGFTTTGSIDLGGATSATVKVCTFTDDTYTTPITCGTETTVTAPATDYSTSITGLDPNTPYYVAVIASNTAGQDVALKQQLTTDYAVPTLGSPVTPTSIATSISVAGNVTSLGGASSTDVKVCAYTNADYSGTPVCGTSQTLTATGDFTVSVDGLTKNTTYYLAVVSDNGHKTDTVKTSATTLNTILTITNDKSSTTAKKCPDNNVVVTYTATVTDGTASSYTWSTSGGTAASSTTNTYTVTYASTGSYTVSCIANGTGISETSSIEVSDGIVPELGLCEECRAGSILVKKSTNVSSIVWRNSANDSVSNSTSSIVQNASIPAGTYSATAKSSDGCTVTRTATLGNISINPCSVSSKNSNEQGSTATTIETVQDHQGNSYRVVQIGSQCWMAENMRATTEPGSGTSIVQNPRTDSSYTEPRAYYYNNQTANYTKFGCLYNFPAVMNITGSPTSFTHPHRGICPEGWHIPQESEWDALAAAAGCTAAYNTGTGMGKLVGGCEWATSSSESSPGNYYYTERNSSGFAALPSGYYRGDGNSFLNLNYSTGFWSCDAPGVFNAYTRTFVFSNQFMDRYNSNRNGAFPVRCVRD